MSKQTFKRDKTHLNIGTMGHIDHGKTTLTAAITRVLADAQPGVTDFVAFDQIDRAPDLAGQHDVLARLRHRPLARGDDEGGRTVAAGTVTKVLD